MPNLSARSAAFYHNTINLTHSVINATHLGSIPKLPVLPFLIQVNKVSLLLLLKEFKETYCVPNKKGFDTERGGSVVTHETRIREVPGSNLPVEVFSGCEVHMGRWIFLERKNPEYDFLQKGSKAVGLVS